RSTRSTSRSWPTRSTRPSRCRRASAGAAPRGWRRSSPPATPATGSTSRWPTSGRRDAPANLSRRSTMVAEAPTYDLVMLLDPEAEEQARARPLADARAAIQAQGELLRHDEWGNRTLSYAIKRRGAAEYHLLQFHAGTPELLRTLDRSLRIADEVLRFRIIKLK